MFTVDDTHVILIINVCCFYKTNTLSSVTNKFGFGLTKFIKQLRKTKKIFLLKKTECIPFFMINLTIYF